MAKQSTGRQGPGVATSWEPVADWYAGWAGKDGSRHHREMAVPALLALLEPRPGEAVLDIGAGPGVLAPAVSAAGASYTGVDASGPCFRVPRLSGWGWDEGRKIRYRRVDRYLSALAVPMKAYRRGDGRGTTWSFHRPLEAYINGLAASGLLLERMVEIAATQVREGAPPARAEHRARQEIPLFLGLRARKVAREGAHQ